jgi:hypothetical protein
MGCEEDGRPFRGCGFDGGSGGDLGGFDLEDAELGCLLVLAGILVGVLVGGGIGVVAAQGTFGQAGTSFACSYELAGELDEVGRNVDGRSLEDGRLAEGDLLIKSQSFVIKSQGFGFVE